METKTYLALAVLLLLFGDTYQLKSKLQSAKSLHAATELSDQQVKSLARLSDTVHFNTALDKILVPRVVGTPEHEKVADFIAKEMENLGWAVERNRFKDVAPIFGELEFQNIIARLNPKADRFLVLACHYDSKYMREHNFVGATDSAVPCAMMINLAKTLKKQLDANKSRLDVSLAFIFFDGEEAFRHWGPKDSIYGARHLASQWGNEVYQTSQGEKANNLERMDMLILLDLIGTPNPKFYSYFDETEKWFVRLSNAEERLGELGLLRSYGGVGFGYKYFIPRTFNAHIEDDHLPFMRKNVPILHLIPTPFPDVWHLPSDNKDALDFDTIENLNKVFRVFVAEYLNLTL